jgi:hypothetical protein
MISILRIFFIESVDAFLYLKRLGVGKMISHPLKLRSRRNSLFIKQLMFLFAAIPFLVSLGSTGCKKQAQARPAVAGAIRVVVLPFSVPENDKDLQWAAMAAPALIAKASRNTPNVTVVPFWEAMPSAIASAGAARSFNDETATSMANWVGAKWAIMGEISRTKSSYSVSIDFIPARSMDVPFRYIKTRNLDSMGTAFQTAIRQWLRYTTSKPAPMVKQKEPGLNKMRSIAEALDREYGWFETANPGNAQDIVDKLSPSDKDWARLLFNPTIYPGLAKTIE